MLKSEISRVDLSPNREAVAAGIVETLDILKRSLETEPLGRKNYIVALAAVARLICQLIDIGTAERLLLLVAALSDLDQGSIPPLLTPTDVSHRRPDSSAEWIVRTRAALALECLKRCGENLDIAAGKLARHSPFDGKTIKNWRGELSASRVKNTLAKIMWGNGLTDIEGRDKQELRQLAQAYIERAFPAA